MENFNNDNTTNSQTKKAWSEPILELISKDEIQTGVLAGVEGAGAVYQS